MSDRINVTELANQVAATLGDDWTAEIIPRHNPYDATDMNPLGFNLRRTDGLELYCYLYNERLGIKPTEPHAQDIHGRGYNYSDNNKPDISVAANKSPTVIARDIKHRLLPLAEPWHAHARQRAKEEMLAWEHVEQQRQILITEFGGKLDYRGETIISEKWAYRPLNTKESSLTFTRIPFDMAHDLIAHLQHLINAKHAQQEEQQP
jgi:hypothetical protein